MHHEPMSQFRFNNSIANQHASSCDPKCYEHSAYGTLLPSHSLEHVKLYNQSVLTVGC